MKFHQGQIINTSLSRRQVSKCNIESPLSGTLQEAIKVYSASKDTY